MESQSPSELYKWQRITQKSKGRHSNKRVKPDAIPSDIEQWIKKVEEASDFAAAQAFGKARTDKSTKASILQTVDQLHDHDAAYDEAQELLNDWVHGNLHAVDDHSVEAAIWVDDEDINSSNFEPSIQNIIQQTDAGALSMEEYDRLMNLDNYNEDAATENILEELRKKEVIRPEFLYDLGDIGGKPTAPKPKKDPSVKMQVRQAQVKVNRDKRRNEVKQKQEQEAIRREAITTAKQKAAEERRKAAQKVKQEEIEIQKEMARIKKELQEEKKEQLRKQEEERALEQKIAAVAKAQAKKKKVANELLDSVTTEASARDTERRRKLAKAIEKAEARHVTHNLKLMRQCFNSWFDLILERRLQLGKARAVSDWKCLFRAWNAWRHYTRDCNLERLKRKHENSMVEDHRKLHQSHAHYEKKLLKKYWLQWQIWLAQEKQARDLANDQNTVRHKMSAFLATGKQLARQQKDVERPPSASSRLVQSHVNEMFDQSVHVKSRPQSSRSRQLPTEAWQITRKHLKLTNKQITDLTDNPHNPGVEQDAFAEATSDISLTPSTHVGVPKSFQNRFNAQQKILQEQQKALKEQKKMIEDLRFKQDRSLLEEQIKQQQVIQQQLEKLTKLTLEDKKLDQVIPQSGRMSVMPSTEQEPPQTARSQASSVSHANSMSSAFSKRMEERATERAKAKQEREERKKKQEQKRVAEMVAKEEELRQQEAEERRRRVEAFKEKRRLEKEREFELQQMKEKTIANQHKADEHSRLRVLKFHGFRQLKQHCERMKNLKAQAKQHCSFTLQRQTFQLWKLRYEVEEAMRNEKADELYNRQLVKRCFSNWTQWRLQFQILSIRADRHYHSRLLSKVFRPWQELTTKEKIELWEKERHARQHDIRRLKSWVFTTWKRLPADRKAEEEKEKRRKELRRKVASILPDFHS
ncbi:coiled-coil domain-containing protein 191-like [Watersipora subatra]|uniref:coiled-coil domain-containing protein 191-like n=1 Tax=Watersipora subatra TaxID=2589382 RepID=UPI00355B2BEB